MAYAGVQMFMEKLKQLINCNHNPIINIPSIIDARPQFQHLYQELDSVSQTIFKDEHLDVQELEKLNDVKKRFTYTAEKAEYIVDLFLSGVHIRNNGHFPTSEDFKRSLDLDDIWLSFKSIMVEFMSIRIDSMKLDSSLRHETMLSQYAASPISFTRNPQGSKKLLEEIVIGLDHDVELIRDKLVGDQKKLSVVSIVGMGGIGKTTLATKVFNDPFVVHHFYVRAWVTISQSYDKRDVLIQILTSLHVKVDHEKVNDFHLRELVHKHLMGKRYLIVIDDIWKVETWNNLKLFFPHNNNGSRILLTSRLTEVAKNASSSGLIHHVGHLNREKSWELLCHKVFHGNKCPKWLIKPGMQIIENCQGLPLAVIIIAGVLAKDSLSENFWVKIAHRTGSYIVDDKNGSIMETLGLSYNHLPLHLRECFLYLGGFPEDYAFHVPSLIRLWVAEGFIQQAGNQILEDTAEGYLMDLIARNLIIISAWDSNEGVRACKVHDLVRELCLRKAMEEGFILQKESQISSSEFSEFFNVTTPAVVRSFVNKDPKFYSFTKNLRSVLYFNNNYSMKNDAVAKSFRSFVLLRVLNLQKGGMETFPKGMELLVHLRYLAIYITSSGFPSSICNLWGLQTLIYMSDHERVDLPSNISDLGNLRHLLSYNSYFPKPYLRLHTNWFYLPSIEKPMNLITFSHVWLGVGVDSQKCFPYIKKLKYISVPGDEHDFKSLTYLEWLRMLSFGIMEHFTLPATLKTLSLVHCRLPWSAMSIITSLPNLQVLKLKEKAFEGSCWNAKEHGGFAQLKVLKIGGLDIKQWKVKSTSFPCLKKLEIGFCFDLEKIPLKIGEIPTLEIIHIAACRRSVCESVERIQEYQYDSGNINLKVKAIPFDEDILLQNFYNKMMREIEAKKKDFRN